MGEDITSYVIGLLGDSVHQKHKNNASQSHCVCALVSAPSEWPSFGPLYDELTFYRFILWNLESQVSWGCS